MIQRKYYAKDNGLTILYGEPDDVARNYPTAFELPTPRPTPYHYWDIQKNEWYIPEHVKKEMAKAEQPTSDEKLEAILEYLSLSDPHSLPPKLKEILTQRIGAA